MISVHCGSIMCRVEDLSAYSERFPTLEVYPHVMGDRMRLYGVQRFECAVFSTPEVLFNHLDALERFLSREEERWQTAHMQGEQLKYGTVHWIYVHLFGLPSPELLSHFSKLCSSANNSDTVFESKYTRLAITMTIKCCTEPYTVTIRSTANGHEEKIKLNNRERNAANPNFAKFQRNIVHIKQRRDITAFFYEVFIEGASANLTAEQIFQLLSEKIMSYDKNGKGNENSDTWEMYMGNTVDDLFDFVKFQLNYDAWIQRDYFGATTYLIGPADTKGYRRAKNLMIIEARKHQEWVNEAANIVDPVIRQCCMKKPPKHLPPMYFFLDHRKRRKSADPNTLFAFDEAGSMALLDKRWDVVTYEVGSVIFDSEASCMLFSTSINSVFKINKGTSAMFYLYIALRMLLECTPPDAATTTAIYDLVYSSPHHHYIFSQLVDRYQLVQLALLFAAGGYDVTSWQEPKTRPSIADLNPEVDRIRFAVEKMFIVDREIMVKYGKQKRRTLVQYTIGQLQKDIHACLFGGVSTAYARRCELNKNDNAYFKYKGVVGPYPSVIMTQHVVLGKMIYVLLPDGTLRFCIESQNPDDLTSKRLTHSEIASMGPVLDAGEIFLRREPTPDGDDKWIIFKINNSSGHYQPTPSDGLQGVEYLLQRLLKGNPYFDIERPRCSLANAVSTTRLSVVDNPNVGGVVLDETTQELGSNL